MGLMHRMLFCFLGLSLTNHVYKARSEGDLCVSSDDINACSTHSKWATGTPYLTVTHTINTTALPNFLIIYSLKLPYTSLPLCTFTLTSSRCRMVGDGCMSCSGSGQPIITVIKITNITLAKNRSNLTYTMPADDIKSKVIQEFTISDCPDLVGNAAAKNVSSNPCGYGCTSQFDCKPGYENLTLDDSTTYNCTAAAEWNLLIPTCVAVAETTSVDATPTTTSLGLSPDPTGTAQPPPGSTEPAKDPFPNAGLIMAVIGGLLFAAGVGVIVYVMLKEVEIQNKRMLNGMFVLCVIAGAVGIGLVFGNPSNQSAVIGGIVVGSLALAGMFVIIGFQIKQIISPNTKAIQGKPEPNPEL